MGHRPAPLSARTHTHNVYTTTTVAYTPAPLHPPLPAPGQSPKEPNFKTSEVTTTPTNPAHTPKDRGGQHSHSITKPTENPHAPIRAPPPHEREGQGPHRGRETAPSPQPEPKKGGKQRKQPHQHGLQRGRAPLARPQEGGAQAREPQGAEGTTPPEGMAIQTKPGPGGWSSEGLARDPPRAAPRAGQEAILAPTAPGPTPI